jgi:hypothetical protein
MSVSDMQGERVAGYSAIFHRGGGLRKRRASSQGAIVNGSAQCAASTGFMFMGTRRVAFAAVQEIPARNHTVSQFLAAGFILLGIGFAE